MTGNKTIKTVVIGGGTGTFVVLSGLKKYPLALTAIVTMMDSGGSTGRLRDQYGVLPPGDVRQALVALSGSDKIWRELFLYRFENGDFEGHNFGNIFLSALEKTTGNFEEAIELAEKILQTKGKVVPVTLKKTNIVARLEDNTLLKTEALIDKQEKRSRITDLYLEKNVPVNRQATKAIQQADIIVIGPGDLYTSILPNFMFNSIVQAYKKSRAKKVFILNLMNKLGQTDDFRASQYINIYKSFLGDRPFDHILVNTTKIPERVMEKYQQSGENEVVDDLDGQANGFSVHRGDFLGQSLFAKPAGDKLQRSLIRHDDAKLADYIWHKIVLHK